MDECGFKDRVKVIKDSMAGQHSCGLAMDTGPCYFCEAVDIIERLLTWPPRIEAGQCSACGGWVCGGCGRGDCP